MDEPLSNLDAKLRLEMRAEIRRIHNELGATTIYVTHDQDEALSLADRIVVLRDGVIRQVGTPKELYEAPSHFDVADFMGFRNKLKGRSSRSRAPRRPRRGGRADQRHRPRARHCRIDHRLCRHPSGRSWSGRPVPMPSPRASTPSSIAAANSSGRRIRPAALDFVFRSTIPSSPARIHLRSEDERVLVFAEPGPGEAVMDAVAPAPAAADPAFVSAWRPGASMPSPCSSFPQRSSPCCCSSILRLRRSCRSEPKAGGDWLANYRRFFSDPFLYKTIANTLWLAIPVTLVNLLLAVPIAFRVPACMRRQRLLTTILVLPITLGTVLVAEGLLGYLGPQGWFNRTFSPSA